MGRVAQLGSFCDQNRSIAAIMSDPSPPDPKNVRTYVDWLNEEKFKERKAFISFITTLATSVLAFTVSFRRDVIGTNFHAIGLLKAFWILLLVCVSAAVVYHLLEIRYVFYERVRKVTTEVPFTHYAGIVERRCLVGVVFVTPISFVLALLCLTLFVIINTT